MLAEKEDVLCWMCELRRRKQRPLTGGLTINIPLSELRDRIANYQRKEELSPSALWESGFEAACFKGKDFPDAAFLKEVPRLYRG